MSYINDSVNMMPPGEALVRGRETLRAWYSNFLSQYHASSLTLGNREVIVGDGWAVEIGTYECDLPQPPAVPRSQTKATICRSGRDNPITPGSSRGK